MIVMTFLALWLMIIVAPDTPLGRLLRSCIVDRPASWLGHVTPSHIILAVLILSLGAAAVWAGGADAARMLGMATPEMIGWIAMFDVATYIDVVVALALVRSKFRLRMIAARFVSLLSAKSRNRRRVAHIRRTRPTPRKAANDDGESHPARIAA